jgi:hypothetical protein
MVALLFGGVALGLIIGAWLLSGDWHTAVSGQVNIGRLDDAWVPAWFANIGIPAGLLWLVFLWGWWAWRGFAAARGREMPFFWAAPQTARQRADYWCRSRLLRGIITTWQSRDLTSTSTPT